MPDLTRPLPGGTVPEAAIHLGTWNTRAPSGAWFENFRECTEWWRAHIGGFEALPYCWRASFYYLDCVFVVAWCYDRGPEGRPYLDEGGDIARLPPRALIIGEAPPLRLLGGSAPLSAHGLAAPPGWSARMELETF